LPKTQKINSTKKQQRFSLNENRGEKIFRKSKKKQQKMEQKKTTRLKKKRWENKDK